MLYVRCVFCKGPEFEHKTCNKSSASIRILYTQLSHLQFMEPTIIKALCFASQTNYCYLIIKIVII